MSRKDVEWIVAETRRLEALGVVLGALGLNGAELKRAGRPRLHGSKTERQRAYRNRKSEKPLTAIMQGREMCVRADSTKRPLGKVTDLPNSRKSKAASV